MAGRARMFLASKITAKKSGAASDIASAEMGVRLSAERGQRLRVAAILVSSAPGSPPKRQGACLITCSGSAP